MINMRALISLVLVAAIGLGIYYVYLKQAAPAPGVPVTAAISTTGVQMDLTAIAQGERTYYTQSGTYATLDQLMASGASRSHAPGGRLYIPGRDFIGRLYRHRAMDPAAGASATLHYPTYTIDETMQVRRED